jgi:hypothetical protein
MAISGAGEKQCDAGATTGSGRDVEDGEASSLLLFTDE